MYYNLCCSVAQSDSLRPHGLQHAVLSFTISRSLLKLTSIESVMPFNYLILFHPLSLLSVFPSMKVFSNESVLHVKWPSTGASAWHQSSNEYSELISFRIDWLDLLAVQVTLKSRKNHQFESISSVDLSLLYGWILTSVHDHWKNCSFDYMDLCQQSYVFVFHMLSQLKSPSSDFEAQENKICHCFHFRE